MELCVHKYLYNYIIGNQILTPFQAGFIPGHSTTYQFLHTYHSFVEAVDSGKEIRVLFCDSQAFERVWHKGLLHKLSCLGINEDLLQWFKSYLSHRRHRFVYHGIASESVSLLAGVPRSSILGPLLFLIYINDIVNGIRSCIRLFAHETSLYIIVDNPVTSAFILNSDLDSKWAANWLVDFNPQKTSTLLVTRKQQPIFHPTIKISNVPLKKTTNDKHLGITLTSQTRVLGLSTLKPLLTQHGKD